MRFTTAAASLMLASSVSAALSPIVVKGTKFFVEGTGKQFYMKGIAYQQDIAAGGGSTKGVVDSKKKYIDPLADEATCKIDVPLLKELNTNTIRVYAIDPSANHDPCMKLLDEAGIYVIADLSEPNTSINRNDPQWDAKVYKRYTDVVDVMAKYTNTLGFFAGNEVSDAPNNTLASAFVKAAVRDTKTYIKNKGYRTLPVGYATNDHPVIRDQLANYFNCGPQDQAIDFWGYNIYSWCGESSFEKSGFDKRTEEFANYTVPVFFAEYGCNEVRPRPFTEVAALFGPQMTDVWSGGLVYMFHEEANKFGVVKVSGSSREKLDDFDLLADQMGKVRPVELSINEYTPANNQPRSCPAMTSTWEASPVLPPSPNSALCECMIESLECSASGTVDEADMGGLFGYICAEADCGGIATNGTTGKYGAFSMCNPQQRLSWAMNSYYLDQNKGAYACDFDGRASIKAAATPSACASSLREVGGVKGTATPKSSTQNGSNPSAAGSISVPVYGKVLATVVAAFAIGFGRLLL